MRVIEFPNCFEYVAIFIAEKSVNFEKLNILLQLEQDLSWEFETAGANH